MWGCGETYGGHKQGGSGLVEDDESEAPAQVADHMVGRVRRAVAQRLVGLDDQNDLV